MDHAIRPFAAQVPQWVGHDPSGGRLNEEISNDTIWVPNLWVTTSTI